MGYIIKRKETSLILNKNYWLLLYGRRKVGKTFLLRELCKFDNYYTIKKDLNVISNTESLTFDKFIQRLKTSLSENKTVVVDEFQRINESVWDEISLLHPHGKLILSGSSLRVVKKVFEPQSSLLGFFTPVKLGFINPLDMINNLKKEVEAKELIEIAAFLREPWLVPLYNKEKVSDFVYDVVINSKHIITSLVGEIFTEEERELTKRYEAILTLIGSGIWNTKEITSILYSRKLIPDPSPTHIFQYLKNLEEMELVESIKLYKTKGNYYRLASPIMNIYYYLDSRYDLGNRSVSFEEVKPTIEKLVNLEIQNFIADLFAEYYDGRKEYYLSPEKEVDFIITKRNKPEIIGEVKWKNLTKQDIIQFKKGLERFSGKLTIVCKASEIKDESVNIVYPKDIIRFSQEKIK